MTAALRLLRQEVTPLRGTSPRPTAALGTPMGSGEQVATFTARSHLFAWLAEIPGTPITG